MAGSPKRRRKGKRKKPASRRGAGSRKEKNERSAAAAGLIRALDNDLRRRILRKLNASAEPISPVRMSKMLDISLSTVSYHFSVLRKHGAVVVVDELHVRGAVEHFYASALTDCAVAQILLEMTEDADEGLRASK